MQRVFLPGIALLNRMGYTKKFTLLWLVSLATIAVLAYSLFVSLDRIIQPAQRQLQGLALIEPISRTVQIIQRHRGISAALLGGSQTMQDRRAAKEKEAAEAFKAMEGALPASLASSEDFRLIKANWERLRKQGLHWTMDENFTAHTSLIEQLQFFELSVADDYVLIQDPDLDTFYLIDTAVNKLPHVLEHLGQLRAYGTGTLAGKRITEPQKAKLNALIFELDSTHRDIMVNLDKACRYNPAIQNPVSAMSKNIADLTQQLTNLVTSDILTGRFATSPDDFLDIATVTIDKSYAQLYESLLPMTESLIKARTARTKNTLYINTGIASLAFLLVVYLSVSIYYAIVGNIRSLVRSARAFASGRLHERVKLDTRDELSWVGDSFNEMADGFNAMLKARHEDEARLRATIESAMDAVVQMDAAGIIIGWNSQAENIFGWTSEEAVGRALSETIIPPQYREAHVQGLERFLLSGEGPVLNSRIEVVGLHRDGHEFPVELAIAPIKMAGKYEFSAFIRDITKRKKAEEDIHRLAFYDPLTNLPNRRLLLDRLQHALATSARSGRHGVIMFIDLDNFKVINDTKGHDFGDLLLIEAARRLQSCVRGDDTVARIGGDEFVVMLEDLGSEAGHAATQAEEVAEKIRDALNQYYLIKEDKYNSTASIGINLFADREISAETLLKHADIAMYQAKGAGRNTLRFFDPEMQAALESRAAIESDLHRALVEKQFRLYYQAQVDNTGRIFGAEALVRWIHPQRGMVPPFQFIPIAEESSLILDIGQWVLETACRQLALWGNDKQKHNLVLAVNVSARQFKLSNFVDKVAAVIKEHRINPSRLKLELTESVVLADVADIVAKMHALKALGVGLSMDDFGTGYSSLSYLKQLPLDQLKIDKSFVNDIATNPNDAVMVRTIIDMAHNFRLNVIAEGVETEVQLAFLKQHGCHAFQGYLYSKPVPIEEFEALLGKL